MRQVRLDLLFGDLLLCFIVMQLFCSKTPESKDVAFEQGTILDVGKVLHRYPQAVFKITRKENVRRKQQDELTCHCHLLIVLLAGSLCS